MQNYLNDKVLSYNYIDIPYPKTSPEDFKVSDFQEPIYDPNLHLDFDLPEYIVNLKFEKLFLKDIPDENDDRLKEYLKSELAFTSPFKVLSDKGLEVIRQIIEFHKENTPKLSKHTNRQAWCMRGLGYVSRFIRDFNRCPIMAKKMSYFAGKSLTSHAMPMHYSHVNIGVPGTGKKGKSSKPIVKS